MSHSSLTSSEAERLELLAEEASEICQAAMKILRHGYDSYHPSEPGVSNRQDLDHELRDLIAIHILMQSEGDLPVIPAEDMPPHIKQKLQYTHHQRGGFPEVKPDFDFLIR